jgi:hydroxyacylglutathione hydrolase
MLHYEVFEFSPFAENTYLLYDDSGAAVIIDPGCYFEAEQQQLQDAITKRKLKVERHLLTHAHLDHVFGSAFVHRTYGLLPEYHAGEQVVLDNCAASAARFGIPMDMPPNPGILFDMGNPVIRFGESELTMLFVPGHSPASVAFYCAADNLLIAGDTLFHDSIGRTDLPGGDHETLIKNIREVLLTLPKETTVLPGHGRATTIGREAYANPFLANSR